MELLRAGELIKKLKISRTSLWRISRRDETFPKAIRIAPNVVVWEAGAIEVWLKAKAGITGDE